MRSSAQPDLQALKALITHDPSTTEPHYFRVLDHQKILTDQNRQFPELRQEVMTQLPRFAADRSDKHSYSYSPPSAVANILRQYPSLTQRFSVLAFSEIDEIETALVMHEDMSIATRSKHRLRLQKLTESIRPVWENWILSLHPLSYNTIDREVRAWLKSPIDWDEAEYFRDDWEDVFYAAKAAKAFFDQIKPQVLAFVGIELGDFTNIESNKSLALYQLTNSIRKANSQAKSLGLKCRFRT